jgi:hypothetical protein
MKNCGVESGTVEANGVATQSAESSHSTCLAPHLWIHAIAMGALGRDVDSRCTSDRFAVTEDGGFFFATAC